MKCMPMTLSGLLVALANLVIEIDEVLLAMIASGFSNLSNFCKTPFLTSKFSTMAYLNPSKYLNDEVTIFFLESLDVITEGDSLIELFDFLFVDAFLVEFFA